MVINRVKEQILKEQPITIPPLPLKPDGSRSRLLRGLFIETLTKVANKPYTGKSRMDEVEAIIDDVEAETRQKSVGEKIKGFFASDGSELTSDINGIMVIKSELPRLERIQLCEYAQRCGRGRC